LVVEAGNWRVAGIGEEDVLARALPCVLFVAGSSSPPFESKLQATAATPTIAVAAQYGKRRAVGVVGVPILVSFRCFLSLGELNDPCFGFTVLRRISSTGLKQL
jgi:hypothetical protein